jgi:ribosome biogenesis GTPase A
MLCRSLTQQSKWSLVNSSLRVLTLRYVSKESGSSGFFSPTQRIPSTPAIQNELVRTPSEYVKGSRLLQVAILGVPNAGKSTLVNQLSGWQTCSVSKKVHTTRKTSKTVLIRDETQIVFLDTPGLVAPAEAKQ